ncbi:fimbria/pilus periplasmic chaperone [Klebsiella aerogenes]|uniref:fimbria/pilus periplasmic chaperone n=1 Tax=Klebsiella aerogenes TaxID=548 RepID=UPI0038600B6B
MKLTALTATLVCMIGMLSITPAKAAIALDRTRVIFNGDSKSLSMNISNENKQLPYLAQGWIEDAKGNKITSPLLVLPPVQRIEAEAKSQLKIQGLPQLSELPQDRETLFYFNLREIPPRSDKPNTLQIALQTRIKLFYRPQAIVATKESLANPWQEKITLTRRGDSYQVNNPTPYYITLVDGGASKGQSISSFQPLMIAPFGHAQMSNKASAFGSAPVITYINDFGGRPQLTFRCAGNECQVDTSKSKS